MNGIPMNISEFKPEKAQRDRVWLILGSRNTGKSVLLKDLLYRTQKDADLVMGMTQTMSTGKMFRCLMPPHLVYTDGYSYEKADEFLKLSSDMAAASKERHTCLVMDDVVFDNKILKSKTQQNLHLNGRHYHTSIFNTSQFSMLVPTTIRANCDYIIALKETVRANRRRLFEHYFGIFDTFGDFERVFNECTKNFGAMVLDRTQSTGRVEDLIKYYRAQPGTPSFRLGKKIFWDLSEHLDSKARAIKKEKDSDSDNVIVM